ncbi:MAG: hypothetical protein L3J65_01060 [Robiginitomaculum sp.]|nr:hypothetical protein [Robiginitomaculum sp.]
MKLHSTSVCDSCNGKMQISLKTLTHGLAKCDDCYDHRTLRKDEMRGAITLLARIIYDLDKASK